MNAHWKRVIKLAETVAAEAEESGRVHPMIAMDLKNSIEVAKAFDARRPGIKLRSFLSNLWREWVNARQQAEIVRLITRAGRRCARDLRHAADEIPHGAVQKEIHERAEFWKEIFWDASAYRDQLHHQIDHLENEVNTLKKTAAKPIPF